MRENRHPLSIVNQPRRTTRAAGVLSLGMLALSACSGGGSSVSAPPASTRIEIQPMTTVVPGTTGTGYFSDPYPIPMIAPPGGSAVPAFSGTSRKILSCPGALQPDCYTSTPDTIDAAPFASQLAAAGISITGYENLNAFQDSGGAWHMAVTLHLHDPSAAQGKQDWFVIMHASPVGTATGIPVNWSADAVLVGSLKGWAAGNYDGKYFDDSGTLYLVYSMNLPGGSNGIAAQAMLSAKNPASSAPVPLLGPETANGGYNSELFYGLNQSNTYKQIETGNITKIQGKYVMTYSAGGYNQPDYKAGIAWSDNFLPSSGAYYTRAQKVDTAGVWGQANHAEVQYLLQSQESQWPNYVAAQVLSPGVPSIISDTGGHYYLVFAGYAPSDAPLVSGNYDGSHRRPFYVGLNVQIPSNTMVSATSPQALAGWVQPVTGP